VTRGQLQEIPMAIRQRAIQVEEKQERHAAILDAAERLLLRSPERVANVSEVADEAGLAKGTVYLYFPGKEELLLALHERNVDAFFVALCECCDRSERVRVDDVLALAHAHMIDAPLFLPLACRCFGQMAHAVDAPAAEAFRQRMAERLVRAGAALERHFPALREGGGVVLLRHSYALILGLWQMANASACEAQACAGARAPAGWPFAWKYAEDIDVALGALWRGALANPRAEEAA
jgi:AcrR family transcriptional regulator